MASAGRGIGWTRRITRIPTATKRILPAPSGRIGIGSSTPTTTTCRLINLPSTNWRAIFCPDRTLEDNVATGFLRNSMLNEEGGIDPEQFRIEAIIERMDVLGKAFLGLTVNCCQCHNHKYDPISQKEYYRLFAFLNNDDEPAMEVPDKSTQAKREAIRAQNRRNGRQAHDPICRPPEENGGMGKGNEGDGGRLGRCWSRIPITAASARNLPNWTTTRCWRPAPIRMFPHTLSRPRPASKASPAFVWKR